VISEAVSSIKEAKIISATPIGKDKINPVLEAGNN
jgi:hypothetical protein